MTSINRLTNEQLLSAIQQGDRVSFNELYYRFRGKVYGYAYRFTRSSEESEELTQDVFVRIWENRAQLDPTKSFEGYLFIMIRNNYLKALRSNARESLLHDKHKDEKSDYNATDDYLNFKDCQQIVSSAIEAMSPQARIAYMLSRNEGCSHEEISKEMGISKNTVNKHINSSLKTIRKYLKINL